MRWLFAVPGWMVGVVEEVVVVQRVPELVRELDLGWVREGGAVMLVMRMRMSSRVGAGLCNCR